MASDSGMQRIFDVVNKLQDACAESGTDLEFNLPQIAVVGSQSAGKSSVLENIVGRDFLPRGSGVVTRRPLILQLITSSEEYGEFLHCKNRRFNDFNAIREEIEAETDRIAKGKAMSNHPISLRIYSPDVVNLTLVDLPGMTKVPIKGQPSDIERQIREMILHFISHENCLILAVSPANTDLANSDALKLARMVDPEGNRTIGVITKLDLMDQGTDALDILENREFPLRRGYVGIVNRSQADINGKKDIRTALESEADYFKNHPVYKDLASRCGTRYLRKVLSAQLFEHIKITLPKLGDTLHERVIAFRNEIDKYKESHPTDEVAMRTVLFDIIDQLKLNFEASIGSFSSEIIKIDQLSFGARICQILQKRLPEEISKIVISEEEMYQQINIAIKNIQGYKGGIYTPDLALESVAKREIQRLVEPIRDCVNLVIDELVGATRASCKLIKEYPKVAQAIETKIISYINLNRSSFHKNALVIIDIESALMDIANSKSKVSESDDDDDEDEESDDESNGSVYSVAIPNSMPAKKSSSMWSFSKKNKDNNELNSPPKFHVKDPVVKIQQNGHKPIHSRTDSTTDVNVDDVCKKISSYMGIVRKNTCRMIPKAITLYIIDTLRKYVNRELQRSMLDQPNFHEYFDLSTEELEQFAQKERMCKASEKALATIRNL